MTKENALANFLDSQDFFELMQAYRHAQTGGAQEYGAVRIALYAAIAQPVEPTAQPMQGLAAYLRWESGSSHINFVSSQCLKQWATAVDAAIAQPVQPAERNFCQTCGQRLGDADYIHTCTPPESKA